MLSFYKAPSIFVKKFNQIQSDFLWDEVEERRRIHLVSWKDVSLSVVKGGLGIKRIEDFNVVLLQKWRWRILDDFDTLGYNVLKSRYADINLSIANVSGSSLKGGKDSLWWRDLSRIVMKDLENLFADNCSFIIGNGYTISFWLSNWIGNLSSNARFLRLFSFSCLKHAVIASM